MFKGSKQEEVQRFTLGVRYKTSNYKLVKTPVDMVKINWKQKRTEAIQQPQYAVIPKSRVKKKQNRRIWRPYRQLSYSFLQGEKCRDEESLLRLMSDQYLCDLFMEAAGLII